MLKRIMACTLALLAALMTSAAALQQERQTLAEKLIRLHVVANSDGEQDQQDKLLVRDAILAVTDGLEPETLEKALPEIRQAAEQCLRELGREAEVQVSLGCERFPTRLYENFALPAGLYRTLRVTIGRGEGHNWWCVAFPSICLCATAEELEEAAAAGGFSQNELRLITEDGGYVLKFKCIEWLETLKAWMFRQIKNP